MTAHELIERVEITSLRPQDTVGVVQNTPHIVSLSLHLHDEQLSGSDVAWLPAGQASRRVFSRA